MQVIRRVLISLCMIFFGFISSVYANHQGYDCSVCHDSVATRNLNLIREVISTPNSGPKEVWFTSYTGWHSFADGDTVYDGVCEVCHTVTSYHRNDGTIKAHFDGQDCIGCHPHTNDFYPTFTGSPSHLTHFSAPKGPQINYDCTVCHFPGNFSLFVDGNPLATTTVCDPCHSPVGAFDGVNDPDVGAKPNWDNGIYEPAVPPEEWPSRLKAGKENWCATCHDNGSSVINGVSAPNVMGDNTTYGYNVSGHGRDISCDYCHDLTMLHADGDARTYSASSDNYREGYRLNEDMAVPRYGEYGPIAFALCFKCHDYSYVMGPKSNFRDDNSGVQLHEAHLSQVFAHTTCWDSDWNENLNNCTQGECADSAISCTACHNVHGSPTPAMIRHGELISTPGTTDKVPALDFRWYKADGFTQTMILGESRYGGLLCGQPPYNVSFNHVCWGCHPTAEIKYYRIFPRPTIGYSPTSFRFNAIPRDINPPKQSLHIWNAGDGTLNWSVSKNAPWLSLHPTTGTDSRTVDVLIDNRELIREGTYIATITITATGATNSPVRINVMLTIGAPVPDIRTPVTDITFGDVNVGNFLDRTTTIYNDGSATLTVNSITRSFGSTEFTYVGPSTPFNIPWYGSQTVTVRFSPTSAGAKTAAFNVNSNDPSDPDITFNVSGNGVPTPQVTFFSPNGGEVIPSGSTYTIQWGAPPEAVRFDIGYSLDDGAPGTWKLIASGLTSYSYNVTVPALNGNKDKCRVGVRGYNASGGVIGIDTSDNPFTIEVVKVTYPNNPGELLISGNTYRITWQTNGTIRPVQTVKIYGSPNEGQPGTWMLLKTLQGNPGYYDWIVPTVGTTKDKCKIGVVLLDSMSTNIGQDGSDSNFTIQPAP